MIILSSLFLVTLAYFQKTKIVESKFRIFSYPSILTDILGAQKNRLIETVPLSTHYKK